MASSASYLCSNVVLNPAVRVAETITRQLYLTIYFTPEITSLVHQTVDVGQDVGTRDKKAAPRRNLGFIITLGYNKTTYELITGQHTSVPAAHFISEMKRRQSEKR